MKVSIIIHDLRLGAFSRAYNIPPNLDPFPPWLSFSKVSIELYASPFLKDSIFLLPLCLYGAHKGDTIAHKTTHDEYIRMKKFIPM
jgi:hypothetical protein